METVLDLVKDPAPATDFAAVGEIITERAGKLNLGVQGMMLVGAVGEPDWLRQPDCIGHGFQAAAAGEQRAS